MKLLVLLFSLGFCVYVHGQDTTGVVYLVYGSDTSTPGINVNNRTNLYHNSAFQLYASPSGNGARVMDTSYRTQFLDSFGNPLVLTWWMQGGSLYRYARNTNVPFGSTMSMYLMQKYYADQVELVGDEMSFHYHTWGWSDLDGDGRYYWNQVSDFNEVKEDFIYTLVEHFLEEEVFPVSFRSGWHYMDNAWQEVLDQWIPFSLHNNSPVKTDPVIEPIDNLIDWERATLDFVPFRPSENDYQLPGGSKGWNTRSRYFLRLTEDHVHQMFQQAREGIDQVACIWGHLAEPAFLSNMEYSLEIIYRVAQEYPDVPFKFSTAVDAMQEWLNTEDSTPPVIDVQTQESSGNLVLQISSDEAIFQETPFVTFKDVYERHHLVEMEQTGESSWQSKTNIPVSTLAKWGVAVTDTVGNLTTMFEDVLPQDLYLDNSSESFSIYGSGWSTSNYISNNHIWDEDIHQVSVQNQDSLSATWSATIDRAATYEFSIRFPFSLNGVSAASVELLVNGSHQHTSLFDGIISEQWLFIEQLDLQSGDFVEVILSTDTDSQQGKELTADVIKISPLIRERSLHIPLGTISFPPQIVDQEGVSTLQFTNRGTEPILISGIESELGFIDFPNGFPIQIEPRSILGVPVRLFSTETGVFKDSLSFLSNDPLQPVLKREMDIEFRTYFSIIDNDRNANYQESGAWQTSSTQAYGQSSRYAFFQDGSNPTASYFFNLEETGFFELAYLIPGSVNSAERAVYSVYINDSLFKEYLVNQNEGSGNWVSLDLIQFDPSDEIEIRIRAADANQPNKVLRADAVRLSYIGEQIESAVVDNDDEGYSEIGNWKESVAQALGNSSRFVEYNREASASFEYVSTTSSPHQISYIVPSTVNASNEAEYNIFRNSQLLESVILNQNEHSGNWRPIGNWYFNQDDTIRVRVSNVESFNSSRVLRADGMQFQFGTSELVSTELLSDRPTTIELYQNYPNPFNPSTTFSFYLPTRTLVHFQVFDILGREIEMIINNTLDPGFYSFPYDASSLSSGVYFYRLETPDAVTTRSFVLIK